MDKEIVFGKKPEDAWRPFPANTEIKYFSGNVAEASTQAFINSLATCSFKCAGDLKKKGDVCIITETGAFDKHGDYHILIKYAELPEDLKKNVDKKNN